VQVKRNAKTKEVREAIQKAYIKNVKNYYAALKVDEEVVDEKDDIKKESVVKKQQKNIAKRSM
jgi:predicted DNA-binding protein